MDSVHFIIRVKSDECIFISIDNYWSILVPLSILHLLTFAKLVFDIYINFFVFFSLLLPSFHIDCFIALLGVQLLLLSPAQFLWCNSWWTIFLVQFNVGGKMLEQEKMMIIIIIIMMKRKKKGQRSVEMVKNIVSVILLSE